MVIPMNNTQEIHPPDRQNPGEANKVGTLIFSARPPSYLEVLENQKGRLKRQAIEALKMEAGEVQCRLKEQLTQVRTELDIFQRLMYKNKNQHRRSLYYRRLSQVRRELQILGSFELEDIVKGFAQIFLSQKVESAVSRAVALCKAVTQPKAKDKEDRSPSVYLGKLLDVARVINQIDEPILAASTQIAGLLAQSFFMPFALSVFSSLARFRVLLMQVLYELITAFNLLSAYWEHVQKSSYLTLAPSDISTYHLPVQLECQWKGDKLCMTEKQRSGILRDTTLDVHRVGGFVEGRMGVKHDFRVSAVTGSLKCSRRNSNITTPRSIKRVCTESSGDMKPTPKEALANSSRPRSRDVDPTKSSGGACTVFVKIEDPGKEETSSKDLFEDVTSNKSAEGVNTNMGKPNFLENAVSSSGTKRTVAYISIAHKINSDTLTGVSTNPSVKNAKEDAVGNSNATSAM